ncbi:protein phosphatase methylesterase 1 [Macrophomina phaseolina]|uniref:Protein phosphatase methylesterase 1 n=1 Tax=Macrophomina phaseolina TaxID=35725 RepID=A0ABQ8GPT1_9PEZI|nr:protein phosphatase methylesterase 1 [Macrophomina phaseolina]
MSDLAKTIGKSKVGTKAPSGSSRNNNPQIPEEEPGQQTEDDSSSASSVSSAGTVVPTSTQKPATASAANVDWTQYFSQELYLEHHDATTGQHAQYHIYMTPAAKPQAPLLVLHHGAGSSALTWALFALEVRRLMPEVGVLAVEAREHGSVVHNADGSINGELTVANLAGDLCRMVTLAAAKLGLAQDRPLPQLLLVGHSLGGAVVTETAKSGALGASVLGYAVLDVVEGSAMDALKHMHTYLSTRPSIFPSLDAAVDWHIRSRTLRNPESARASVPSLLKKLDSGKWVWKTDLARTETFWTNWFEGLSGKFLTARGAKLLLLAGTDRLDKELMIGQMQGKFQLQVYPMAGHFLQEDVPDQVAQTVVEFLKRNDRSTLVLPPKVSDLLAQGKKV